MNYIEDSIRRAYLNGTQNLNWILGEIRASNEVEKQDLAKIFSNLRELSASNIRFQGLEKTCKQEGLL
jgi:uncharacterized Fe-S radical SAM superfamily protein PflX